MCNCVLFTLQNVHFSKSTEKTINWPSMRKIHRINCEQFIHFPKYDPNCTVCWFCSLRDYFAHRMELDLLLIKEYLALFVQTITDCSCFLDKKSVYYSFCANFVILLNSQVDRPRVCHCCVCIIFFNYFFFSKMLDVRLSYWFG